MTEWHGRVIPLGKDSNGNDVFVRVNDDGLLMAQLYALDVDDTGDIIQVVCDPEGRLKSSAALYAVVDDVEAKLDIIIDDVDGIEADLTTIIGHIDGIEGQLTTIAGHIDGLEQYILDTQLHYKITDIDDGNATYDYFGFTDKGGNYYIMRADKSGGDTAWRYTAGSSGYTTAWTNRASESYDYFYNTF